MYLLGILGIAILLLVGVRIAEKIVDIVNDNTSYTLDLFTVGMFIIVIIMGLLVELLNYINPIK
jgi:hypothetical protein